MVAQVHAAQETDSAIADRVQDYRNRLALAYQAAGRAADAEPLLQQLLDAEPEEGTRLDLLTRLGSVQVLISSLISSGLTPTSGPRTCKLPPVRMGMLNRSMFSGTLSDLHTGTSHAVAIRECYEAWGQASAGPIGLHMRWESL